MRDLTYLWNKLLAAQQANMQLTQQLQDANKIIAELLEHLEELKNVRREEETTAEPVNPISYMF